MHVCFLNISEKKLVHILNCRYFSGCTPWKENWYFFVCILEKKIRNNSVPYLRVPHFLISHFQVGNIIQLKKNKKKKQLYSSDSFNKKEEKQEKLVCLIDEATKTSFGHLRDVEGNRFFIAIALTF